MPGDASVSFESAKLDLVEVGDLPRVTVATFEQHLRHGVGILKKRGEVDSPEVDLRIENFDAIKIPVPLLPHLVDHASLTLAVRLS